MDTVEATEPLSRSARGRPTAYDERYVEQVAKLCALGATDEEIADFFNVHVSTIYRWKLTHPEFCEAIQTGREPADDRVERSLYQQAIGHYVTQQETVKLRKQTAPGVFEETVEVVELKRYVPSVPLSAIFWLRNRRPGVWRDVRQIEQSGPNGSPMREERTVKFIVVDPAFDKSKPRAPTIEGQAVIAGQAVKSVIERASRHQSDGVVE